MWDIPALVQAAMGLLGKFIPDVNEKAKVEAELQKMLIEASTMQQQINVKEAEHASMFVAGWRPFIGWVCGTGCAYSFVAQPMFTWFSTLLGGPVFPSIDTATLMGLLTGMLGLGGMRTYEKVQEVARDNGIQWPKFSNPFKKNKANEPAYKKDETLG